MGGGISKLSWRELKFGCLSNEYIAEVAVSNGCDRQSLASSICLLATQNQHGYQPQPELKVKETSKTDNRLAFPSKFRKLVTWLETKSSNTDSTIVQGGSRNACLAMECHQKLVKRRFLSSLWHLGSTPTDLLPKVGWPAFCSAFLKILVWTSLGFWSLCLIGSMITHLNNCWSLVRTKFYWFVHIFLLCLQSKRIRSGRCIVFDMTCMGIYGLRDCTGYIFHKVETRRYSELLHFEHVLFQAVSESTELSDVESTGTVANIQSLQKFMKVLAQYSDSSHMKCLLRVAPGTKHHQAFKSCQKLVLSRQNLYTSCKLQNPGRLHQRVQCTVNWWVRMGISKIKHKFLNCAVNGVVIFNALMQETLLRADQVGHGQIFKESKTANIAVDPYCGIHKTNFTIYSWDFKFSFLRSQNLIHYLTLTTT